MADEKMKQECLERCVGIILRYIDELCDDIIDSDIFQDVLDDFEFDEIELADADEYGSEEYEYYEESEAREEMKNQIESILSDAEQSFDDAIYELEDCVDQSIGEIEDKITDAIGYIGDIIETFIEGVDEYEEYSSELIAYCEDKLKSVISLIEKKTEEINKFISHFSCDKFVETYFKEKICPIDEYIDLCDIDEDEDDDEDIVYAYILDDALEKIQDDVNEMLDDILQEVPSKIDDKLKEQLANKFEVFRSHIRNELKEYMDSAVVMESYKDDDGDTYRIYCGGGESETTSSMSSYGAEDSFGERLRAEVAGTAMFVSGFFRI